VECVSCKEVAHTVIKTSPEGIECIIFHSGFQIVCLDPLMLDIRPTGNITEENAVEGPAIMSLPSYALHLSLTIL